MNQFARVSVFDSKGNLISTTDILPNQQVRGPEIILASGFFVEVANINATPIPVVDVESEDVEYDEDWPE